MSTDTLRTSSPRRPPAATLPALVVALALIGIGVVGVHDLLAARGGVAGRPWLEALAADLDGLSPSWWTTALGVVVALLGLALMWTALRPARRTHQATPMDDGDVWISKRAVGRLAEHATTRTSGIESARVDVRRRKIVVRARTGAASGSVEQIRDRVEENVRAALDGFSPLPVTVRTKKAENVS